MYRVVIKIKRRKPQVLKFSKAVDVRDYIKALNPETEYELFEEFPLPYESLNERALIEEATEYDAGYVDEFNFALQLFEKLLSGELIEKIIRKEARYV